MSNSSFYDQYQTGVSTMGRRGFMMAITGFTAMFIVVAMLGASFSYGWTFTNTWLYIGFLLAAFTHNKQALHDMVAGTFVVDRWAYTEFPERQHHPKETELLFPPIAQRAPEVAEAIARLDREHAGGEAAVRELGHLLLAWELMGESRRATFVEALDRYITFYLEHMRLEETVVLPAALQHLTDEDWAAMDAAFASNTDVLAQGVTPDPAYERLFSRIVHSAPPPLGMGR